MSDQSTSGDPIAAFGPNEWLVDELYQQFLTDKSSVDKAWWGFVEDYRPGEADTSGGASRAATATAPKTTTDTAPAPATSAAPDAPAANGSGNGAPAPAAPPAAAPRSQPVAEPKTEATVPAATGTRTA